MFMALNANLSEHLIKIKIESMCNFPYLIKNNAPRDQSRDSPRDYNVFKVVYGAFLAPCAIFFVYLGFDTVGYTIMSVFLSSY